MSMFSFNYKEYIKSDNLIAKAECIDEFIYNFPNNNYTRNWYYNNLIIQEGIGDLYYEHNDFILIMEFCILPFDTGRTSRTRRNKLRHKTKERSLKSATVMSDRFPEKKICYCSVIVDGPEIIEVHEIKK